MKLFRLISGDERGSTLIGAVMLSLILSVISIGYLQVVTSSSNSGYANLKDAAAFYTAESGLLMGKTWLNTNYNQAVALNTGDAIHDIFPNLQINGMTVRVDVVRQATGVKITGTTLSSSFLGYDKSVSQDALQSAAPNVNPFQYAGFGRASVNMSGNGSTDSYNSDNGAYGGGNVGNNGDVGTNGTGPGTISLGGNSTINGDAGTGAGGTVSLTGNAAVNGSTTHATNQTYASVSVPAALTGLAAGGAYSGSSTINAGSYKYSSFSVSGNNNVVINGHVTMYVTGDLSTSGNGRITVSAGASLTLYIDGKVHLAGNGVINNTSKPSNFLIQSTYSGADEGVKITGNGNLFGAIYAPDTEIKIAGNGATYGALISNKFTVTGNGDIHYDQALQNTGVSVANTTTIDFIAGSWASLNTAH